MEGSLCSPPRPRPPSPSVAFTRRRGSPAAGQRVAASRRPPGGKSGSGGVTENTPLLLLSMAETIMEDPLASTPLPGRRPLIPVDASQQAIHNPSLHRNRLPRLAAARALGISHTSPPSKLAAASSRRCPSLPLDLSVATSLSLSLSFFLVLLRLN
ncbi:hypothetical protein Sjap_023098 [Stephania japonica]|uniref:Uncharacterized protein n=1 Tax=Stephania japonica TaxID=461633 RepID=A0AAP0EQM3_9MAGN